MRVILYQRPIARNLICYLSVLDYICLRRATVNMLSNELISSADLFFLRLKERLVEYDMDDLYVDISGHSILSGSLLISILIGHPKVHEFFNLWQIEGKEPSKFVKKGKKQQIKTLNDIFDQDVVNFPVAELVIYNKKVGLLFRHFDEFVARTVSFDFLSTRPEVSCQGVDYTFIPFWEVFLKRVSHLESTGFNVHIQERSVDDMLLNLSILHDVDCHCDTNAKRQVIENIFRKQYEEFLLLRFKAKEEHSSTIKKQKI